MNISTQRRVSIGFGFVLGVISLIGGAAVWSIDHYTEASKQADRIQETLLELEGLISDVKDAETGQRGYIITGRKEFLEPYHASLALTKPRYRKLARYLSNEQQLINQLDEIEALIDEKFAEMKQKIQLREAKGFAAAQVVIAKGEGKVLMDAIRQNIAEIKGEYVYRLQQQKRQTTRNAQTAIWVIGLGFGVAGSITSFAIVSINRDLYRRTQTEVALKTSEQDLQQANERFQEWIGELEDRNAEIVWLNQMSDQLQACLNYTEAGTVVTEFLLKFFPNHAGAIFLICESQPLAESWITWGNVYQQHTDFLLTDCLSLRQGRAILSRHTHHGLVCQHLHRPLPHEYSCIPMQAQGEVLGVLHFYAQGEDHLTTPKQELAKTIARQIALALANLKLRETLQIQSTHDTLTGLFNRRYLDDILSRELRRAQRQGQTLSILMVDVDHFKRFNDTYGHAAGDAILKELGHFLRSHIRESDIACRYGGEELTVILPDAAGVDAQRRAEELRLSIKQLNLANLPQIVNAITVSIGISTYPKHGTTGEELLIAADMALYQAKEDGRDRVVVANSPAFFKDYPPVGDVTLEPDCDANKR